ncbi:PE domain-containing protein [Nocardia sp. CDC159]|uniref:PE domain-containing protein n=1 Tax=Nocardia pulmonis TaxID=2951408 RepID=A0A9X2IY70_9NOCA|nr:MULTISPECIES: PE domain-containing protein [Nocardia]MCM6776093.1 PE domain-containing protein [Nocardia pulmonis]MCM6788580.1 PE domain-containing protein [Nocardia sp. CDC159]
MVETVNFAGLSFDPAAATDAAARLDALAQRLEDDLRADEPALTVPAAGVDEVSVRAAETMNGVAGSFSETANAGILELRKLAASLRAQVSYFGRVENDSAAGLGGAARSA